MCASSCPNVAAGTSEHLRTTLNLDWIDMDSVLTAISIVLLRINRLPQSAEWLPALWGPRAGSYLLELSPSVDDTRPEPGGLCHTLHTESGLQVSNPQLLSYSRLWASLGPLFSNKSVPHTPPYCCQCALEHQMCIHPQLEIVPNKYSNNSGLSNICVKLQRPAVWGKL